jgi:hypothetical protein
MRAREGRPSFSIQNLDFLISILVPHLKFGIFLSPLNKEKDMPDQAQKNRPVAPSGGGGGDGPSAPKVDKPNTEELLKRMRKVDPDQAKRYRQRTGQ